MTGKKRKREGSDEGSQKKKEKKSKDSKEKKDKKNKRKHACEDADDKTPAPAPAAAAVEEKELKQVETPKKQALPATIQKVHETPKKKQEQPKKEEQQNQGGWNNWSKATFGGDTSKQDKFMRLLGAKKGGSKDSGSSTAEPKKSLYGSLKSAIDEDENQRITHDLEKQFRSGIHFRQSNRRGGLGS